MLNRTNFKSKDLTDAEEYYKKLHIESSQRRIVRALAKVMVKHIEISEMSIMGFCWRALQEWQKKHKTDVSEISNMDPENRIKSVSELIDMVGANFKKILLDKEKEPAVDKGLKEVLAFYKKLYANRKL